MFISLLVTQTWYQQLLHGLLPDDKCINTQLACTLLPGADRCWCCLTCGKAIRLVETQVSFANGTSIRLEGAKVLPKGSEKIEGPCGLEQEVQERLLQLQKKLLTTGAKLMKGKWRLCQQEEWGPSGTLPKLILSQNAEPKTCKRLL